MTPEERQADKLEKYLFGLESGRAFDFPDQDEDIHDDAEIFELMRLGRNFKVLHESEKVVEVAKTSRRKQWWLGLTIPTLGAAIVLVFFLASPTKDGPVEIAVLSGEDKEFIESQLVVAAELGEDIQSSLEELNSAFSDVDSLLGEDSYKDIDLALAAADL